MRRQELFTVSLLTALVFSPGHGWAAPSVTSFTGNPTLFPPRVQTKVNLTVAVSNPTFITSSAQLQRQQVDGSWKNTDKVVFSPTLNPLVFTGKAGFNEASTGTIRLRLVATFTQTGKNKYTSPVLELSVGQGVQPSNQDTTIQGASGTSVTIPGGALQAPASVGIAPAPAGTIPISSPEKPLVATVDIIVETEASTEQVLLTQPLKVSVPAPAGTPNGSRFLFVVPVLAPKLAGPGLEQKLLFVDTGSALNGQITTQSTFFPGIFSSTTVAVVKETGTVFVKGTVTDPAGQARPGVWVQETKSGSLTCPDPGTLCQFGWYTNAIGEYRLEATGTLATGGQKTDWSAVAIDGFRCNKALIPPPPATTRRDDTNSDPALAFTLPITVSPVVNFDQILTGIRNGGFEAGVPTNCWPALTPGQMIGMNATPPFQDLFGLGTTIEPTEDKWMAALTSANPTIETRFILPTLFTGSEKKLHLDFHFGCRATGATCPAARSSTIGVKAEVLQDNGTSLSPAEEVTKTFRQFDGQLGWRTMEVDLSNFYNSNGTPTLTNQLRLRFTRTTSDAPDNDATVLLDNIRFDTVFVNVNVLAGVTLPVEAVGETNEDAVKRQVRHANELLSQAGTNLRLRNLTPGVLQVDPTCNAFGTGFDELIADPGTNVTVSGFGPWPRTSEQIALSCIGARVAYLAGAPNSDVEVNYVPKLHQGSNCEVYGATLTVEDYNGSNGTPLQFDFLPNFAGDTATLENFTAIFMNDSHTYTSCTASTGTVNPDSVRETLAHEIAHLFINQVVDTGEPIDSIRAGSTKEHAADEASVLRIPAKCRTFGSTVCSGRVHLNLEQLRRWKHPGPPPGPRCRVTCPH